MSLFRQYDPQKVVVSFGEVEMLGYMDGTFVSIARTNDSFEMSEGAGGDVTRVRKRSRSGRVTVTLKQVSPSNDLLSVIARDDEKFGTGIRPVMVKDLNGTTIAQAAEAWLVRPADSEFGDAESGREWMIDCAELDMLVGGSIA